MEGAAPADPAVRSVTNGRGWQERTEENVAVRGQQVRQRLVVHGSAPLLGPLVCPGRWAS